MLSGLPIVSGDPVRALLVSEHYRATLGQRTCDYSSKYLPRTFPIRGNYNDYGGLEDIKDDVFKRLWVQGLQTDLFELGVGENTHWDCVVRRDMDFDQFWEVIWKERLIVPGHWCFGEEDRRGKSPLVSKPEDLPSSNMFGMRNVRVQIAMIREDVWQTMMTTSCKSWRDDFPKTLETFKELVREYWTECKVLLSTAVDTDGMTHDEMSKLMIEGKDIYSILRSIQGASSGSFPEMKSPVSHIIRDECGLGLGSHWLMALSGSIKPDEIDEFLSGAAELAWFEVVNGYRRGNLWHPSYAGGQERPWRLWLKYHQDMVKILTPIVAADEDEGLDCESM